MRKAEILDLLQLTIGERGECRYISSGWKAADRDIDMEKESTEKIRF